MLPNPYLVLGAVFLFLAATVGAFFEGRHYEALTWKAAVAKQDATASSLLAQLTATAAAKDSANAEFARNLDQVHADAEKTIADNASTAERGFTDRLRRIAASRPRCPSPGAAKAIDPGQPPNSAAGSKDQLLAEVGRSLREIGESAERLRADYNECFTWVHEHGR